MACIVITGRNKDNKHVSNNRQVMKMLQCNKGKLEKVKMGEMFHEILMKRFTSECGRSAK